MALNNVVRVRRLIQFVIAWLIVLYVFEVVQQARWFVGVGAVVVAFAVNLYARKKAAASIDAPPAFYFWHYVPLLVLFVLPLIFKLTIFLTSEQELNWWESLLSLLPFLLKLGVPVAALLWAYVILRRVSLPTSSGQAPSEDEAGEPGA